MYKEKKNKKKKREKNKKRRKKKKKKKKKNGRKEESFTVWIDGWHARGTHSLDLTHGRPGQSNEMLSATAGSVAANTRAVSSEQSVRQLNSY
jgi:hypothetical protein